MADPRYLEAWKRVPASSRDTDSTPVALPNGYGFTDSTSDRKATGTPAASSTLQVRLDTPGGLTYSPSDLTSHNVIKRMFIPYTVGQGAAEHVDKQGSEAVDERMYDGAAMLPVHKAASDEQGTAGKQDEYDFGPDLKRDVADPEISEARKYALSINFESLAGRPEGGKSWEEMHDTEEDHRPHGQRGDAATVSGRSKMTAASTRTTATMATIATMRPDSSLPDWYRRTSAKKDTAPFTVPASYTGKAEDLRRPWKAMRWHGHRAFERPSQRDNERGIASFADVNGPGRAPSIAETAIDRSSDDGASIATVSTKADARSLNVADLFVLDPRISRPLRMVRRTDPRQVLLLCNGVYMETGEVASYKAAQAARDAGLKAEDLSVASQDSKRAQELLANLSRTAEARGGIGVLFCPTDEPLSQDGEALQRMDPRFEVNTCKRLEAAPSFGRNSERRAQLRAALAALELANWEEEGFDKIVIGVEQPWIVRGITTDIWRWRHTGWKLIEQSALGGPGEQVPDRDLWELLDEAVRKYESIDCNVRFWHINARDAGFAKRLAQAGALKDVQMRPSLVRWRKKIAPTMAEEAERRSKAEAKRVINHQGPTLSQVR